MNARLDEHCGQVAADLSRNDAWLDIAAEHKQEPYHLAVALAQLAARYWKGLDSTDFCLQHVSLTVIFGGTNRLIWHPKSGFIPDRDYCSRTFLDRADRLGSLTAETKQLLEEIPPLTSPPSLHDFRRTPLRRAVK